MTPSIEAMLCDVVSDTFGFWEGIIILRPCVVDVWTRIIRTNHRVVVLLLVKAAAVAAAAAAAAVVVPTRSSQLVLFFQNPILRRMEYHYLLQKNPVLIPSNLTKK